MSAWVCTTSAAIVLLLLSPSAAAWMLPASEDEATSILPNYAAWTTDLVRRAPLSQQDQLPVDPFGAVACPLGDVNTDGVDDLLVRVQDVAGQPAKLKAVLGPTFEDTAWTIATKGERVLECAPDLNADKIFDPVTALASEAGGTAASGQAVANEAQEKAMQVIDGVSGAGIINRVNTDTTQAASAAEGAVAASSQATSALMPAVQGAEAFIQSEVQETVLSNLPGGLPVGSLTATARHTVTMQLLDVQGSVEGTITLDQPGIDPLALAPLPVGAGLPQVSALTAQAITPVQEAASQIPTLSLYNPDGTLAWATELAPSQGLPMLVPRAGDLNLDGVQDLIVENVPTDLTASATGQFQVLSGLDGSVLLDSGAPITGLAAALPLGELPSGLPGIVSIEHVEGAADMTLSALDVEGKVAWTTQIAVEAMPINVRADAYTGDPLGFTDLTGDGLADIAVAAEGAKGLAIQALDGATGKIAWTKDIAGMATAIPFSTTASLSQISSVTGVLPTDLLAMGLPTGPPSLSLVDGVTGEVVWNLTAQLPPGAAAVQLTALAAGDLNADQVQDIVLTLTALASAPPIPGAMEGFQQAEEPEVTGQAIYAISGHDGETLASQSTDPSKNSTEVEFQQSEGPALEDRASAMEADDGGKSPGLATAVIIVLAIGVALFHRRRNA